jgi:hypothetical protein
VVLAKAQKETPACSWVHFSASRATQQTGHPELASHRQLASRKRMLEAAHAGFNGGT